MCNGYRLGAHLLDRGWKRVLRAGGVDVLTDRFGAGDNHSMEKRVLQALVVGYLVLAVVTRAREAAGAYTCGCDEDCWCKTPGVSLFRWVFPRGHKNRALADWKAEQDRT